MKWYIFSFFFGIFLSAASGLFVYLKDRRSPQNKILCLLCLSVTIWQVGRYMTAILIVILLSLIGVLGDYFLKLSGHGSKYIDWKWFLLGAIIYSSTAIGWFFIMKHIKLGTLGIVYATTTVLVLTIIGFVY